MIQMDELCDGLWRFKIGCAQHCLPRRSQQISWLLRRKRLLENAIWIYLKLSIIIIILWRIDYFFVFSWINSGCKCINHKHAGVFSERSWHFKNDLEYLKKPPAKAKKTSVLSQLQTTQKKNCVSWKWPVGNYELEHGADSRLLEDCSSGLQKAGVFFRLRRETSHLADSMLSCNVEGNQGLVLWSSCVGYIDMIDI